MRELRVRSPGPLTTVQDLGRFGFQSQGVPPAGAADPDALETANLLVGNDRGEACLECTLGGPELECAGPVMFAVCGAEMEVRINDSPAPRYETLYAKEGDLITLEPAVSGLRSYIAFAGGLDIQPVMGSRSTYIRAGFGGWRGRALRAGDRLPLGDRSGPAGTPPAPLRVPENLRPAYPSELLIRALPSHEIGRFEPASVRDFFREPFRVSAKSDRMGCRLEGPVLRHGRGADIISSGVQTGTIQVPGDGLPIVLLADRQTTGGYTRIAHVIQADLPKLGQARPGDTVRFLETTAKEARDAWISRDRDIVGRIAAKAVRPPAASAPTDYGRPAGATRSFRVIVNGRTYRVDVREAD